MLGVVARRRLVVALRSLRLRSRLGVHRLLHCKLGELGLLTELLLDLLLGHVGNLLWVLRQLLDLRLLRLWRDLHLLLGRGSHLLLDNWLSSLNGGHRLLFNALLN